MVVTASATDTQFSVVMELSEIPPIDKSRGAIC